MISDGIKDRQKIDSMIALDIAEIVAQAMGIEEVKVNFDTCSV